MLLLEKNAWAVIQVASNLYSPYSVEVTLSVGDTSQKYL
jgi:hypothetical protein